jgi:hypothetical protein
MDADLVAVARVIGIIDPKPEARTRKHLEAHWILVERTLKGNDEAGQRLRARPNGLRWEDGKSYVLFLKWLAGDWVEAVPQQPTDATDSHVAAVLREIAAQGSGVAPRRALWMRHTGGWSPEVATEFSLAVNGRFEWKKRLPTGDYEKRRGELPAREVARLVERVAKAGPGPAVDDAGVVSFRWLDATGTAQSRIYAAPDQPPSVTLLQAIEELARRHGRAP